MSGKHSTSLVATGGFTSTVEALGHLTLKWPGGSLLRTTTSSPRWAPPHAARVPAAPHAPVGTGRGTAGGGPHRQWQVPAERRHRVGGVRIVVGPAVVDHDTQQGGGLPSAAHPELHVPHIGRSGQVTTAGRHDQPSPLHWKQQPDLRFVARIVQDHYSASACHGGVAEGQPFVAVQPVRPGFFDASGIQQARHRVLNGQRPVLEGPRISRKEAPSGKGPRHFSTHWTAGAVLLHPSTPVHPVAMTTGCTGGVPPLYCRDLCMPPVRRTTRARSRAGSSARHEIRHVSRQHGRTCRHQRRPGGGRAVRPCGVQHTHPTRSPPTKAQCASAVTVPLRPVRLRLPDRTPP